METVPVDDSSNGVFATGRIAPVEAVPMFALALQGAFSTRFTRLPLILASTSPIRRQMLSDAGVDFAAIAPELDEDSFKAVQNEADQLASELAKAKALKVSHDFPRDWVIGSDSVVTIEGGGICSKPADREDAARQLRAFSDRRMKLVSAVALACDGAVGWSHATVAELKVRELSEDFIEDYLDAEWPDVAYTVGVFRMEGRGVQLFEWINGDYFAILGMPLLPLLGALRERGLLPG
jgi:septum formation protein